MILNFFKVTSRKTPLENKVPQKECPRSQKKNDQSEPKEVCLHVDWETTKILSNKCWKRDDEF